MSQTSADVNANINPVYADVIKVDLSRCSDKSDNPEMFGGWRNWTLRDIVRILKDMAKPKEYHGRTAVVMGNIVFRKQRRIRMFLSR